MKNLVTIFFLVVGISHAHCQQYGWVRVAQVGTQSTTLKAVEFVDSVHGWTGSGSSVAFRTTDGGNTWIQSSFDVPVAMTSISMLNPNIGWCVGAQGTTPGRITKTTDGGANWFQQYFANSRNYLGTSSLNPTKNITSGTTTNFSPDTGQVVQTTNGGTTWTERTIDDSIASLRKMQFIDSLHGWIVAWVQGYPGGILRTTDGGSSWQLIRLTVGFHSISFIDTVNGWSVRDNSPTYCYRTTDGGLTWLQRGRIFDPVWDDLHPSALSFVDSLNGWAFGSMFYQGDAAAVIFHTTDGGLNWYREHVGGARSLLDGKMLNRSHGWTVGEAGSVFAYRIVSSVPERVDRVPKSFALKQNYPNPFNPSTTIEYEIVKREQVSIKVYDTQGKEVRTLVNSEHEAGVYRIRFNATGLASSTYYYTLKTDSFTETKQMVLVK